MVKVLSYGWCSSISLGLLLGIIVLFWTVIDELDAVSVLSTSIGLLTLLVSHKWLDFINIVEFTVGESQMVSLIETSPNGGERIWSRQEKELWHVEDVEELGTVTHVEPHPISVWLQTHWLESEEFEESRGAASPPMRVRLVLVEEARVVLLRVVVVGVCATTTFIAAH